MEMVGHRTEGIYRRYSIPKAAAPRLGAEKLAALHAAQAVEPAAPKVVGIETKRR
jgi:hypothetical protein